METAPNCHCLHCRPLGKRNWMVLLNKCDDFRSRKLMWIRWHTQKLLFVSQAQLDPFSCVFLGVQHRCKFDRMFMRIHEIYVQDYWTKCQRIAIRSEQLLCWMYTNRWRPTKGSSGKGIRQSHQPYKDIVGSTVSCPWIFHSSVAESFWNSPEGVQIGGARGVNRSLQAKFLWSLFMRSVMIIIKTVH